MRIIQSSLTAVLGMVVFTTVSFADDWKQAEPSAEYHFSQAQAYSADGNTERAIEEYQLAAKYDSKSALISARLAAEYIKKGSHALAMDAAKDALKKDPNFTDARLMLAGLYSATRDFDAALKEYDFLLKQNAKDEESLVYKAQVLFEMEKFKEAKATLTAFLKKNPASSTVWYYLGRAENQTENTAGAEKAFLKAIELNPKFSQAALSLGYLYETKEKTDLALKVYQKIFSDHQDISAANRISTIYLKNQKYKEAEPFLEYIQAADPEDSNAKVKLGLVQMELKLYAKAAQTFEKILKQTPDSDRVRFYLGSVYEEIGDLKKSTAELIQIKPDSRFYSEAVVHAAYLMKKDKRSEEARTVLVDAMKKDEKTSSYAILLASIDEDAGEIDKAIVTLEKARTSFSEDEKVLYYVGSLYDKKGEIAKALTTMESILKKNPENVDALNYVGYTLALQNTRMVEAGTYLKKAKSLKPENAYIQDSWGWYLFVSGKVNEAVVELEKAAKMRPLEPTILDHLADAYLKANLRDRALSQYEGAQKIAEDDKLKKSLDQKIKNLREEIAKEKKQDAQNEERVPASSLAP